MTDLDALAREMEAAAPTPNGGDPLKACGLSALTAGADLSDVADVLRKLVPLLPTEALERRVIRGRVIAALKELRIADATGLVDAALPPAPGRADDVQGQVVAFADPAPAAELVDGEELLERVRMFISRFLGVPAGADVLLAAFAVYTYAVDAFVAAPYIVAHSPAPQCGKTRLLEVLAQLVRRPWLTIVPSTAVLFRVLEQSAPTLLLDEAEVVHGRGDAAGDVRALLQAGYRRGAFVPRCVGDANEVRNFRVFGPKVFALIGELPPALFDRCIRVEMQRRPRGERLARFRPARLETESLELRRLARRWADDHREALGEVDPPALPFLDERAEEVWSPLFAVGLVAGGGWYERLVQAAEQLSGGHVTTSAGVELLADIQATFAARGTDRLASADLATALNGLEGQRWADWSHGKGITANGIARQLRGFGVAPATVRIGDATAKGYRLEQFQAAWAQYVDFEPSHPSHFSNDATISGSDNRNEGGRVTVAEMAENPRGDSHVTDVTVQMQGEAGPGLFDGDVPPGDPDPDEAVEGDDR